MKKKTSYLSEFIKGAIDKKYRTRSEAAAELGIDESVLSRICSGKRPGVSEKIVEKICDKLGLDKAEGVLKLFLTKHSKIKQFFSKPKKPITFSIVNSDVEDKLISPEKILKEYSAVPLISNEELGNCISLKQRASVHTLILNDWLDEDHNIQCCKTDDNSMDVTLPIGSMYAVDYDDKNVKSGDLYLLKWKNKTVIRRILVENGYLLFCPDNTDQEKYPIQICNSKKASSLKDSPILGRVIWSVAKL